MNTICTTAIGTALLAATFAVPFVPTTARAGDPTAALQRATEYQQQAAVAREQAGRHARLGNVYGRTPIGSGKGLGSHFRALAAHFRILAKAESANLAEAQRTLPQTSQN